LSREVTLDLRTLVKQLAEILYEDPLKLISLLHETQDGAIVDVVPHEITLWDKTIHPTEMGALSWVFQQETCPVTRFG